MDDTADPAADLLQEIEAFLSKTGMSPTYFGRRACGNTELVQRLNEGKDVGLRTAKKVRAYIAANPPRDASENAMDSAAPVGG